LFYYPAQTNNEIKILLIIKTYLLGFFTFVILMMVLLMGKPVFRNYGDTLEIAELLPALFRKPFYDYKEWWGYF
jgi:hypothetical protein